MPRGRDLQALAHAATPALDALLVSRIDKFSAARLRVALFVLLGALVALFLFIGFFVSTRRGVRDISDRLSSLRDNCSADLSTALQRMTDGDLTVEVTPVTPLITDDLTRRARRGGRRGQRDPRQHRRVDRGLQRMRESLAELIGTVAPNAGTVSAASQQMAATSDEDAAAPSARSPPRSTTSRRAPSAR